MKGLLSCTLLSLFFFLINIPHSPASQAKLPHLYLFRHKPASPQHSIVFIFCFLIFSHFISPAGFHFALKSVSEAQWGRHTLHTQTDLFHRKELAWKVKKPKEKAGSWHPCFFFFFSLCLSEREPFIACSVAADKAGPFVCGSHSESETGGASSKKTLAHHRSALPAPLAK